MIKTMRYTVSPDELVAILVEHIAKTNLEIRERTFDVRDVYVYDIDFENPTRNRLKEIHIDLRPVEE